MTLSVWIRYTLLSSATLLGGGGGGITWPRLFRVRQSGLWAFLRYLAVFDVGLSWHVHRNAVKGLLNWGAEPTAFESH